MARDELHAANVEMTVIDCRAELIAYYERRGYARTGEARPFPVPCDPPLSMIVLAKSLGPATVNLDAKFALIDEHWRPKVAGRLNGQEVKLVKTHGVFPWHVHADADEMFLVWKGRFRVEFRDHVADLGPGEMVIVPRGVEHRTASDAEAEVLIFEPAEVCNTGDVVDPVFTAPNGVSI